MNNQPKRVGVLDFIFFSFVFCPVSSGAIMTFKPNDGNVRYFNDVYETTSSYVGSKLLTGDYDGNGKDDVAVFMSVYSGHRTILLFLSPFDAESSFSIKKNMEVRYAVSGEVPIASPSLAMADISGDGRADLIWGQYDFDSGHAEVTIMLGKTNPTGIIDLDKQSPDCRIVGVSHVAVGDFDGDGISDLAMAKVGSAVGYVGWGGGGLFSGTIDLTISNPFHRISLGGNLPFIMSGDFNGDKKMDFAFSSPGRLNGEDKWREVDMVFGKETLPDPPSLGGLAVDVRIFGNSGSELEGKAVGDVTGDGRADLFLGGIEGVQGTLWAIDGADISGGKPVLLQSTGQPNSVTFYPVEGRAYSGIVALDFDGDSVKDIFLYDLPQYSKEYTRGFLTSDFHPKGISLHDVGSPVMEYGGLSFPTTGDLNGDGFKDLVFYDSINRIYPPYGALRVFYGFRPLANPSIRALPTEIASPRVSMELKVDGNPTEMLLSGDITNEFKDKWIPFASVKEVLLTPIDGSKKVSVIFKNAVSRTSELTQTTVDIQAKSSVLVTGTNRLRPGGTVAFDCHVMRSGSLRVRIFSSAGMAVCDLENRMVEPGIYPLFWNGRNGSGNRVGPGVYYLMIETNGDRMKKEILVE